MIISSNPFNVPVYRKVESAVGYYKDQTRNRETVPTLTCPQCGTVFNRLGCYVRFRESQGSLLFCSRSCSAKYHTSSRCKISEEQIAVIRNMRARGRSSYRISEDTGLARNTVMKYWK